VGRWPPSYRRSMAGSRAEDYAGMETVSAITTAASPPLQVHSWQRSGLCWGYWGELWMI
jgi:hypothetical protein